MSQYYQLKITLADSKPPIWRRVVVPEHYHLEQLHYVIQACFDWDNSHLFGYQIASEFIDDENQEQLETPLSQLGMKAKSKFKYVYDFGDNWEHIILIEKIISAENEKKYPYCLTGKRAGPPEDSGGIWGYEHYLSVLKDKNHPEHEEIAEWMGDHVDPEAFELAEVNKRLAAVS